MFTCPFPLFQTRSPPIALFFRENFWGSNFFETCDSAFYPTRVRTFDQRVVPASRDYPFPKKVSRAGKMGASGVTFSIPITQSVEEYTTRYHRFRDILLRHAI